MTSTPFGPEGGGRLPAVFDPTQVSPSRRYEVWRGNDKDSFAADRASAAAIKEELSSVDEAAAEMRRFMNRAVGYLAADCGIRRFLDIGCGWPAEPYVHQIAQAVDPSCRVVYVDNDLHVGVHARVFLADHRQADTAFVAGDLLDPDAILGDATVRGVLDFDRPIGVLLLAVLHFITDDQAARAAVDTIKAALPPGSYVAISHATFDHLPEEQVERLTRMVEPRGGHGPFRARHRAEVAELFHGLELVAPGVVSTVEWHADREPKPRITVEEAVGYAGIARRP